MPIIIYHHPFTRAAITVWMVEELEIDYSLEFVDVRAGGQKSPEILALNPMGKLPILVDRGPDGDTVVTESAAIGLYLADRYAPGRLAPALDDPRRGTYLRWSLFAPSVIEPGCLAKSAKWEYRAPQAGFGTYEAMLDSIDAAIGDGPYLLGEQFTMADVIFGGTVRFMLRFDMLDKRQRFVDYAARLDERPALQRAEATNKSILADHGITS